LEFIYRNERGYFLAQNPKTVLSRYIDLGMPGGYTRRAEDPLDMLLIVASPSDQMPLDTDKWENLVTKALEAPISSGKIKCRIVKHATQEEIHAALLEKSPNIIQFVGHGIYQEENNKGYLALVDTETEKTWRVDDKQFADILLGFDDRLGLVSLATCESARSSSPEGFLGIAPKIVQRGIPAVVGMRYKVFIDTAEIFLKNFYGAIAARKPADWAVQSARNVISIKRGTDNREFATPVLYMRAKDGEIF
jgi:hypothetical protein